jgi:hypothetical protein
MEEIKNSTAGFQGRKRKDTSAIDTSVSRDRECVQIIFECSELPKNRIILSVFPCISQNR